MHLPPPAPLITLNEVGKTFASPVAGGQPFCALKGITMQVLPGEFVAIAGASGSGKTTLLHLLAGIEHADDGELHVAGAALHQLSEAHLTQWRGREVGVVFQFFQLLPTLTVLENVMLPLDLCQHQPAGQRQPRAMALLTRLGVADQAHKFPLALSGGQQQRVAVARALVRAPRLLLADEPTGNLDSQSAAALLDLLTQLVAEDGLTVLMVSHEAAAVSRAQRCIHMQDGRIVNATHRLADHA